MPPETSPHDDAPPSGPARDLIRTQHTLAEESRDWDATTTAERIAKGDVSAAEMAEAAVARAKASQPVLHAIAHEAYAAGLAEATRPRRGVFAGVPTFVKDMEDLAGLPTRHGTAALPPRLATTTAPSVAQFLTTGPVPLGKSTTAEFGLTGTTEPVHGTPTRNPVDIGHSSGGSSGGASSLVAAGVVPIAHGGDGGGSIRIPGAFCGLVGLKATRGRLAPMESEKRMPIRIATYGVLTRTVRDTARYYAGIEGKTPRGMSPIGLVEGPSQAKLRVGIFVDPPLGTPVDPAVREAVAQAARALEAAGHTVEPVPAPYDERLVTDFLLHWAVLSAGVLQIVRRSPGSDDQRLEPWTRDLAEKAKREWRGVPRALWRLRRYRARYAQTFERCDVLLSPTTAAPAPKIGHLNPADGYERHVEKLLELLPYTPIQNASGGPAISVPFGTTGGLPIGVQLAAPWGEERRLIELAYLLESEAPAPGA